MNRQQRYESIWLVLQIWTPLYPDHLGEGRRVMFSSAAATVKPFNSLIYMSVAGSGLTEIISSAVVIAMQSQLKDYAPTGDEATHNREAQQCFCK